MRLGLRGIGPSARSNKADMRFSPSIAEPLRNGMTSPSCYVLVTAMLAIQTISSARADEGVQCASRSLDYRVELTTAIKGYDGKTCWVHARAGAIPPTERSGSERSPVVVMTLQKLQLSGSDIFYGLNDLRSDDLGKTWIGPTEHAALRRQKPRPEIEVVPCDFTPVWHARTGRLLGTGATFWYDSKRNDHLSQATSQTSYSVYDPLKRSWSVWKTLVMPDEPTFQFCRAGCTQRVDLPDGDILLPVYFRPTTAKRHSAAICRCRFDGETLSYLERGDELTVEVDRGLYEPSLTRFGERFSLTLRNDQRSYVATSRDGLHFDPVRAWTFDDGSDLGSYNTQQHWVTHSDGLFLVYTRRGAKNDHVFRHRAPLFMAQVDPVRLVILRSTERVLVAERGAGLGNFGVTQVSPDETWVITTEWMQPETASRHGSDNSVFVVKLHWNRPNRLTRRDPQ